MTPVQASAALRKGQILDVDLDTGIAALAMTIPFVFRHIDPTQTDGKTALAKFRKLSDNAGLPHDHPIFATWLTLRALRVEAGDAICLEFNCPASTALAAALGLVHTRNESHIIRHDRTDPHAISITNDASSVDETGVIATPAGFIRTPNNPVTCHVGTWATALTAVDKIAATLGRKAYDADPDAIIELDYIHPSKGGAVDADSIHEDWMPEIAFHADLKPHPARLIQSATLATVTPPETTYRPRLPRRVISSGFVSNAQFEFITAAGEAHSRHLPKDITNPDQRPARCGIFLADGTGAGKTNEILGCILDNHYKGRRKAVLVLAKRRHRHGFIEAWAKMGRDRRDFKFQWDLKSNQNIQGNTGILVTTYAALRDFNTATEEYPRIEQISRWVENSFDGIIAFDEAQEMRNAAGHEDTTGRSETSRQGLAGVAIQEQFPDARIIYASATGATDCHNLAYATRLGLWGAGTCFETRRDFISKFEAGGIADLEQVTLSLKAAGVYMARSLSFEGVDTRHLPVTLTMQERTIFNDAAKAWQRLVSAFSYCSRLCQIPLDDKEALHSLRYTHNIQGATPYSEFNGILEASRKQSMATLIAAFKARAVIADAKEQIAQGNAVVIQMQNTYEAQLNRAIQRMEDPSQIRLEPAELVAMAEKLPVEMKVIEKYVTDKGEPASRWVTKVDDDGNPVLNQEAVAFRAQLLAEVRQMKLPMPPLDQIMLSFGPGRLAEVTGRTKRLIPNMPNGDHDGATGVKLEDRTEKERIQDIQDFHDGKKMALVFSTGAGGSSLSYHAKIGSKNTARRVHYVIQLGYRADEVTQGFGRTHRSDQVLPPVLTIVSCDLPADRLYASRIVSSLFKLGALTQGHRHATSNGMFDERDCLDGPYAVGAWQDLQNDIIDEKIKDYTWAQFVEDMGLVALADPSNPNVGRNLIRSTATQMTDVNKMINRVAALTDRRQDLIFDQLRLRIDSRIEKAIAEGSFNAGPETLKATSLTIVGEKVLSKDIVHGAKTRILRIRKRSELATISFGDAYKKYLMGRQGFTKAATFCKHRTTGQIALISIGRSVTDALGRFIGTRDIMTPTGTQNRLARVFEREPWIPFADMDLVESLWNAQVEAAPQETTSYVTIVSDATLPIWNSIGAAAGNRNAVYRLQTDDGRQIVGRPLAADVLSHFYNAIDENGEPTESEITEVISQLQTGARVAVSGRRSIVHFLKGTFTGTRMTGVKIELGTPPSDALATVLTLLNTTKSLPALTTGQVVTIANRAKGIEPALRSLLSCCPALFIEEDKAQANVPQAQVPSSASPSNSPAQNATQALVA